MSFVVGAFSLKEISRLLQWLVFFSWQSHSVWSTFLTILTILKFLLSLRSSIFTSKKLNGTQGYSLRVFSDLWDLFFEKKYSPKGPPSIVFGVFRQNGCWKVPKGPPFQFFRHCETFFSIFVFIKRSPIHQYFDILKSFCYFWALDMAPTWAVLGLLVDTRWIKILL